jgi:dATP pyrophosphohydrolase
VIPQYTFAVHVESDNITLSHEHTEFKWATYEEADQMLHWQSNRTALWELNERLKNGDLRDAV